MLIVEDLRTQTTSWISTRIGKPRNWRARPGTIVMKFGDQLQSSRIPEYEWYYIDYDDLKSKLEKPTGAVVDDEPVVAEPSDGSSSKKKKTKTRPQLRKWSGDDEHQFLTELDSQLKKVYSKTQVKTSEIQRRIIWEQKQVDDLVKRMNERGPNEPGPGEEEFMEREEYLSEIIADVHDLAKFVQVNYTGFYKIVKKHDKVTGTGWCLKPTWETMMKQRPFYKEDYDRDIVKLSRMYDIVRTRGNPTKGDSSAGGSQGSFVRQTTKYWVHPDNVTELKLVILKHLPVLVFNAKKEFEPADSAITSIYYDNPETWDLYEGRLKKTEGAEAIRLRWYGGMQTDNIFVERKTHREDWTGEQSVKARFGIKEKHVNAFMRGNLLPAAVFEKARKDGKKSEKQIAEDERLAKECQWSILKKGYKPVCRSFYNRTAFQLPADARVRISLDTELTMVREDNLDGVPRSGDNWRRMDIGIDYPFSQLPASDIERFPYAVLEVKLQTQHGQEPPEWVRQLISSHLVEAVPKFSKFIHGTATLFPDRINLLPFWMPQMHVDIRKPVSQNFGIRRPGNSPTSGTTSDDEDEDELDSDDEDDTADGGRVDSSNGRSAISGAQAMALADLEDQTTEAIVDNDDYPLYDSDDEYDSDDALVESKKVGGRTYYSTLAKHYARSAGRGLWTVVKTVAPHPRGTQVPRSRRAEMFFGGQDIQTTKFKAPKGKKIYVPVRVEPKVYFAAERTFLGWLEFSIYIGTIAATLLNFGTKPSITSFIVAGAFTLLAILSLCYSVGIYLYRSSGIRERRTAKYYDKWGPSVLCVALFIAVGLNFAFEGRDKKLW
ncbi:VTC domain-containing protein [Xylariales sp. AK1849]|nr:VTC domain-containing protein [Xylariales sp. AK1849]